MAKLVFSYSANRRMGLSFSTHYSSRISLMPGQKKLMPLDPNDTMTQEEIISWYGRYIKDGLTTSYLEETAATLNGTKISSLEENVSENSSEDKKQAQKLSEDISTEGLSEETVDITEKNSEEATSEPASEGAAIEHTLEEVQSLSFNELKTIVQENNLPLKGRGKDDYREAVRVFYGVEV